jgi:hypothetical protein
MRTAAMTYLASAAALGCLLLATANVNCGGTSGERPAASGGTVGSGGTSGGGSGGGGAGGDVGGAGGSSSTAASGLDCAKAVEPANGASKQNGVITDFTDWSASNGRWGEPNGLYGAIYKYAGSSSNLDPVTVDGTPAGLHLIGGVAANDYGGGGLGFSVCMTAVKYSQIQFTILGSSPGCDIELQIQTFDQRPNNQSPPGGCDPNAGSCYGFPVKRQVVDLSTAITTPQVVTVLLTDVENWSPTNAAQVVGLQWQFTGTKIDGDAGTTCPIDVTISDVRFLP